jgi:hypothetical protein
VSKIVLICLCVVCVAGCTTPIKIDPFTNAGCAFFPTSAFGTETAVSRCCLEHDIAYWQGGTQDERWAADEAFRACLISCTGNERLAEMMVDAVRMGGTPHFPSWYGWGYGWNPARGYTQLTAEEQELVRAGLGNYRQAGSMIEASAADGEND